MANQVQDEDDDGGQDDLVEVINISGEIMRFELDGAKYKLKPKQTVKVHQSYGTAKKLQSDRDAVPSTVELLTNKKVLPITDSRAKQFLSAAQAQEAANVAEKKAKSA